MGINEKVPQITDSYDFSCFWLILSLPFGGERGNFALKFLYCISIG